MWISVPWAPGAPSPVGLSLDAEAVVDLGVVPLAQQGGVGQVRLAAVDPLQQLVDVAPVRRGAAAGEHAAAVAVLDGPAQLRGDHPFVPAEVQRHAVGGHHDPGDARVAGHPAGAGGGDPRPEAQLRRARPGCGVGQVVEVDADDHVRLHRPQDRQGAGGQGVVAQLHQGIAQLLGAGPGVAGAAAGLHQRLQRRLQPLPAHRVELQPAADAAVGVRRDRQRAALGGVRLGPVGVQAVQVVPHRLPQLRVRQRHRRLREGPVDLAQVHVLRGGGGPVFLPGDRRDHRDLLGGHAPVGEGRGQRGQLRQRPPAAHDPAHRGRGQVSVPAQPGAHRLQPVVLGGPDRLALPHAAGELRRQPVVRHQQPAQPVQQLRAEHRGQVVTGQGVQLRRQTGHDTSPTSSITCSKSIGCGRAGLPESPGRTAVHRSRRALAKP
ncbi:hypothetical protein FHR93_003568 [Geodermatophilus sabuli]|uniref:Uncharacterized protein n=1 Tax=Geodermatophilus sabuli TaxID=1564158 RepID=A0A285EDV5_9ACTN|nr:hypothetical protein [Geodermatophilus sabuli]SNX96231.1 hypothetical protein SAMN06893097_103400 [Geodermatophilus sabuli]